MEEYSNKITLSKCATVFIFALFAIGALMAFGYYALNVSISLVSGWDIIEFNKGAMYLLGVGLGAGLLVLFMIHELSGKEISNSYNRKATRLASVFIGLIFVFPQLVDYAVSSRVISIGYVFCENSSYRWLHVQEKVFGINADACVNIKTDEITKSSGGR